MEAMSVWWILGGIAALAVAGTAVVYLRRRRKARKESLDDLYPLF